MKSLKLRFSFLLVFFTLFTSSLYSDDLCYGEIEEQGLNFGPVSINNATVIPINYAGDDTSTLEDVTVNYAIDGFNPITFGQNIGINEDEKTFEVDDPDNGDSVYRADTQTQFDTDFGFDNAPITFFTEGINYNLGTMDSTTNNNTIWTESFFELSMFSSSAKLYANYIKDGVEYNVILNPCEGNTESVPSVNISDAFIEAPLTWTTMTFNVDLTGTLSSSISDYSYIHYYTQDGTAKAGEDYTYTEGTLSVASDTNTATIDVPILANSEGNFYLILDNAYAARIDDGNATGTITPSDLTNQNTPICGVFADMFQTRGDCSTSSISFTNAGQLEDDSTNIILQNSDNTLNTCTLLTENWVEDQYQTCGEKGDCLATGISAESLDIIYINPTLTASVNSSPSVSTHDVTLITDTTLEDIDYNDITTDWHTGINTTFNINDTLKINTLKMTSDNSFTFSSNSSYTLDIGTLGIESDGARNTITTDANAKEINIQTFDLTSETTATLQTTNTIKMNSFIVGRGSNITLKAQHVNINNFESSNSGSGDSVINIYADYIDISNLTLGETVTLNIYPYTAGKEILFRVNQLVESSSSSIVINGGEYYVNTSITIPGTSDISALRAMDGNQIVHLYINSDFTLGNNPGINAVGNNGNYDYSLPASRFLIFVNGNFTTDGGGTTINATVYVEGDASFGNPTYIKGAISASQITIGQGQFIYDQNIYDTGYGSCSAGALTSGPLDAWDTFRDNLSTPPNDRNISTKIVNRPFQLSLASLNTTNDAYELKSAVGGNVDVAIYPRNSLIPVSNSITFDVNSSSHIATSEDITVTSAVKEAVVGFKLCATYEHNSTNDTEVFVLHPESDCPSTTINSCYSQTYENVPSWHICYSSDNFAIRPYAFKIFGENQYKRAGEDFNITVKAVDDANYTISSGTTSSVSGVNGYDTSIGDLNITSSFYTATASEVTLMQTHLASSDPVDICPTAGSFANINSADNFTNGEAQVNLIFTETGILDLTVSEKLGFEFALVDADDTTEANRLIQASTTTYDQSDISESILLSFIPYQFQTSAEYNTTNAKNWVYINDINGSNSTSTTPSMAAMIKYTITAQDKFGVTVHNYTKTCFPDTDPACPTRNGLKLNTTFDLFLDATLNTTQAVDISLYTEDVSGSAIFTPNKQVAYVNGVNTLQEWISPKNFTNGIGQANVYFNIDRKVNTTFNPVSITLVDANTSTSWMSNPGSPKAFNGTTINTAKTFVYGRTHASRQRYDSAVGKANIYYDVFCSSSIGTNCDLSLLNTISPNKKRIDDTRWYINEDHNSSTDGNIGTLSGNLVNVTTVSDGNIAVRNLTYTGSSYPYKTTMQNSASPWLIYNRDNPAATTNSFPVEFENQNDAWSGAHETNTTTQDVGTVKSNRRTMW